jgi:hypothetical protein
MEQNTLFFDGETFDGSMDTGRLGNQLQAVLDTMMDGEWWTISDLRQRVEEITGGAPTPQSISARIRDLRKERFGSWEVERKRNDNGLFWYRLTGETVAHDEPTDDSEVEIQVEWALRLPTGSVITYETLKEARDKRQEFNRGTVLKITKHIEEVS